MAILHKRTSTANYVWQTNDLVLGQIGLNTNDGTLHFRKTNNEIVKLEDLTPTAWTILNPENGWLQGNTGRELAYRKLGSNIIEFRGEIRVRNPYPTSQTIISSLPADIVPGRIVFVNAARYNSSTVVLNINTNGSLTYGPAIPSSDTDLRFSTIYGV